MLKKIEKYINHFIEIFSMSLLVIMTVIVTITVFSRYFLHKTPGWSDESALLSMVWFGFLSMAIGTRDHLHIRITMLDMILSEKAKYVLDWVSRILILLFSLFMIIEGINMCKVATGNSMPGLKLNSAFLYAAVPISGVGILCYMVVESIKTIMNKEDNK
ncbi:MAG: TRAP transporter small permease [Bacillota bacterium]|nr:TRAP transporter small permease [Bacillota bacterium]